MSEDNFENIENPELVEDYLLMMKMAENEAELEEMYKNGEYTESENSII